MTDALTGLGNRRALIGRSRALLEAAARRALALFDLDGFKRYNDTFGHPAGDALLTAARAASSRTPSTADGRVYRLGGDEFCVLARAPRRARARRGRRGRAR